MELLPSTQAKIETSLARCLSCVSTPELPISLKIAAPNYMRKEREMPQRNYDVFGNTDLKVANIRTARGVSLALAMDDRVLDVWETAAQLNISRTAIASYL
jgi:hypothetical protein